MVAARIAAAKLQQREQALVEEVVMYKVGTSTKQSYFISLCEEISRLSNCKESIMWPISTLKLNFLKMFIFHREVSSFPYTCKYRTFLHLYIILLQLQAEGVRQQEKIKVLEIMVEKLPAGQQGFQHQINHHIKIKVLKSLRHVNAIATHMNCNYSKHYHHIRTK